MTLLGVSRAVVDGVVVDGDVEVVDGLVTQVGVPVGGGGDDLTAVPGLVDLQVNGFGGIDLLGADEDGWREVARRLAGRGTTAFVGALITADPATTEAALRTAARVESATGPGEARLLGVHLEGPFLSPDRAGTHPVKWLRPPDVELLATWLAAGPVRIVTLAPELPGALAAVTALAAADVVVSLGHSSCDAAQARDAVSAGARMVTHVFNAMSLPTSREPGLAGMALGRADVTVCAIADGVHLADDVLQLVRAGSSGRLVLVSDVMAAGGMGDGAFRLGDVEVTVADGVVRRGDGVLAGSGASLEQAMVTTRRAGWEWPEIVAAVSARPGRLMVGGSAPQLRVGDRADVVVVDDQGVRRQVRCGGVRVDE